MDVLEALARLAGGSPWGGIGHSTSHDRLTTGEISGWFAGCDPFGTSLLWAKYAMDQQAAQTAKARWREKIDVLYRDQPVKVYNWHWLADGTLSDWIGSDSCPVCKGGGTVLAGTLRIDCEACEGRGRRGKSQRQKLKAIGIEYRLHSATARTWGERYDRCYALLEDHAMTVRNEAQRAINKQSMTYAKERPL